ncbi:MAG: hypothetical protein GXO64_04545 [Candidatus Micrarchaeota archaeon]|nr:hypothetical protein [Candidatus Micrarchaeota archaeon]
MAMSFYRASVEGKSIVSDVDRTITTKTTGFEFIKALKEEGIFDKKVHDEFVKKLDEYRKRNYHQDWMVEVLANSYSEGLKNQDFEKVYGVAKEIVQDMEFLPGAEETIRKLGEDGYMLFVLSASPHEVVYALAQKLSGGADFIHLIGFAVPLKEDGDKLIYTGEKPLKDFYMTSTKKGDLVALTGPHIAAVGDSLGDENMLLAVKESGGKAIVANPKENFIEVAKSHGFHVIEKEEFPSYESII